jgi:DNA-binding ferritin-like protein
MPANNRTKKSRKGEKKSTSNSVEQMIVVQFIEMMNTIKLFHWKTTSYPTHKATDELHGKISENIDTFVETMLGKHGGRVNLSGTKTIVLNDYSSMDAFKSEIAKYKVFLKDLNNMLNPVNDSDLLNIRDEILGDLNQFSYLLTFH